MVGKGSNLFMPPIRNSLEPIKYGSKDKMIQIRGLENYRVRVRDSENDLDSDSEPGRPRTVNYSLHTAQSRWNPRASCDDNHWPQVCLARANTGVHFYMGAYVHLDHIMNNVWG